MRADPPPLLRVSTLRSAGAVTVRLDGELDCATAPDLEAALASALRHGARPVIVDAADLTFVDASGLAPLIALAGRVAPAGGMRLRNASPQLRRMLDILRLDDVLGLES